MFMKYVSIAVIVLIIIGGGWWFSTQNTAKGPDGAAGTVLEGSPESETFNDTAGMPVPGSTAADTAVVREFTVKGTSFAFAPAEMAVKKGETVRVTFINEVGTHDWVIDEFNARTKVIGAGQSETIEFVADKTGSFEYYCSVGKHRQMGMKGTLTVTE